MRRKSVVIVGAGFGGLTLARALKKASVDVVLVDQNNYYTFQPLLYQVATAGLEADEIAESIRGILRSQKNFSFRLGRVAGVDWPNHEVQLEDGAAIPFDFLVLAAGASTNMFDIPGVAEHAFELKSLEDAVRVRNQVIRQFEIADADPASIDAGVLNFVIVGGGPTGVETAGALRELFEHVLRKDFPRVDIARTRVVLLEATDRILGPFRPGLRNYAAETLRRRGVEVLLGYAVTNVSDHDVTVADESGKAFRIDTATVLWSAGVRANTLADSLGLDQTKGGRIVVNPDLTVPGKPSVFVIGDMAGSVDGDGKLHPQLAPVAIQGGRHVAQAISHTLEGRAFDSFVYRDKGIMATIGRGAAVTQLPSGLRLRGWIAWMAWVLLHLVQIVGLRNKLYVYANWVYNYFTYDRRARLLIPAPRDSVGARTEEVMIHD